MILDFFNINLFIVIVLINWALHFVVNHNKRSKKGEKFILNAKTFLGELLSLIAVLVISFLETLAIVFVYRLF